MSNVASANGLRRAENAGIPSKVICLVVITFLSKVKHSEHNSWSLWCLLCCLFLISVYQSQELQIKRRVWRCCSWDPCGWKHWLCLFGWIYAYFVRCSFHWSFDNCFFKIRLSFLLCPLCDVVMTSYCCGYQWRSRDSRIGGHVIILWSKLLGKKSSSETLPVFVCSVDFHETTSFPRDYSTNLHKFQSRSQSE